MNELESEIHDQVTAAQAALLQARAADDDYLAAIHQSELDSLARTATDHGLRVDLTDVEDEARAS